VKRISIAAGALFVALAVAPAASAREDTYWTVVCDGTSYESVDARAVDKGGKDAAVALFSEKTGMPCALEGPFED
jgi:hypothetical protein